MSPFLACPLPHPPCKQHHTPHYPPCKHGTPHSTWLEAQPIGPNMAIQARMPFLEDRWHPQKFDHMQVTSLKAFVNMSLLHMTNPSLTVREFLRYVSLLFFVCGRNSKHLLLWRRLGWSLVRVYSVSELRFRVHQSRTCSSESKFRVYGSLVFF
jgi:hypothetical protein